MAWVSLKAKGPKVGLGRRWFSWLASLGWASTPLLPCSPFTLLEPKFPLLDSQTHHQPCILGWREGQEECGVVTVLASHRQTMRIGHGDYHPFSLSKRQWWSKVFLSLKSHMTLSSIRMSCLRAGWPVLCLVEACIECAGPRQPVPLPKEHNARVQLGLLPWGLCCMQ